MVTILPVSAASAEAGVLCAIQGNSQHVFRRGGGIAQNLRRHHHGPRGHRTSPSRSGQRLHLHFQHQHQHHHLNGPDSLAHPHGHGDRFPGGRRHRGGPDHGLKGLHGSRGLQDVAVREHGPHFRRIHRSLSPHGMVQNRSSAGSPGSPHRGHRGPRGHGGHCDGTLRSISFRRHHLHNVHSQDLSSGSDRDRSSPPPAAIDQGIEQLGQLSLRL